MTDLRLDPAAAATIREEIARAGGREVCFLAEVGPERTVVRPRAVARGNRAAVLAVARDAPEGALVVHNHPSGALEPSDADLGVASRVYQEGLGSAIVDNDATTLYVVVEPPEPREVEPLDPSVLDALVSPGGALSSIHEGYEDRPCQQEMLRLVTRLYNDGGIGVVEAGTGTGKSLAYLLPAVAWTLRNGERTVVSTATINLQEQLATKDLPLVREVLDEPFSWALVKGRGNYVSIRRARLAASSAPDLFEDAPGGELDAILEWLETTRDGSLSDLTFVPDADVWEEVRSDTDICLRAECPHFQECHYQRSRREAASADVLIVNHHLLLTDLAVRRSTGDFRGPAVLPPYRHVVLDEAHNLEDAATSHLGSEASRVGLYRALARLDRKGKGVLATVQARLLGGPPDATRKELLSRIEGRVRPGVDEARVRLGSFFDLLEPAFRDAREPGAESVRIEDGGFDPADDPAVDESFRALATTLESLRREVERLRDRIEGSDRWSDALEGRLLDLRSLENRVAAGLGALRTVLAPGDEGTTHVRWIERRGGGGRRTTNLALAAAPVEPRALLRELLFERVETAVLTSATLATRDGFGFLRGRLGLDDDDTLRVEEKRLASPFDYRRQGLLCVPTDLPDARAETAAFDRRSADAVWSVAEITDGGVLALFTSYRALDRVAEALRERGVEGRWPLYVHGEAPRARLMESFARSGRGILLGTASFWEGIDVPGRPLRALVLQKLPFRVPTEPITEARVEAIEEAGGNAFTEYMLPLAAIRLKQGFGRLVRSRDDRGAVVLLDDRIVRKSYGRYLVGSLPEAPLVKGPWEEVARGLEGFYDPDGTAPGPGEGRGVGEVGDAHLSGVRRPVD